VRSLWLGVLLAAALAAFASPLASRLPDGLEHVASDMGFLERAREHEAPAAGYQAPGIRSTALGTAVSGVFGVVTVALATLALGRTLARPKERT
jgi:hypothetical protein